MRIEVKDLDHIYNAGLAYETYALKHVSLTLDRGELVCLIGHTGSGKTTLVQHLNGLLKPDKGQVLADGVDINEKSPQARALRRKIGLVFQYPEYQLFEETVFKDVCFGPKNMGLSEEECAKKANDSLKLVGMDPDEVGDKSPFALSGGQKRRVAIAGILAMDPEVLILDEPAAGLDPAGKKAILSCIKGIKEERNICILLISHNMEDVAEIADRVLVMDKGSLVLDGPPGEVFAQRQALRDMGLAAPPAARFMEMVAAGGGPVSADVLTLDDAAREIIRVYGKR
ncbi:MAG: energy-coupling factor transporter ATPase [Firmicutes bacterium]|nr:energy-coupling factor transporter ATPase [Bacillota bacterium]